MHSKIISQLLNPLGLTSTAPLTAKTMVARLLTSENRQKAEAYLLNVNDTNREYILDVIYTLRKYQDKPLSNTFYLHEYAEYVFTKNAGNDYSLTKPKPNTLLDCAPHFQAVLVHSYYLFLLAREKCDLSLESIIEYDPISDTYSKDNILADIQKFPTLDRVEKEKDITINYFAELIKAEPDLCSPHIFSLPPAPNAKNYFWLFGGR